MYISTEKYWFCTLQHIAKYSNDSFLHIHFNLNNVNKEKRSKYKEKANRNMVE